MLFLVPFDAILLPVTLPLDARLDRPVLVLLGLLWVCSLFVVTAGARPRLRGTRLHAAVALFFFLALFSVLLNAGVLSRLGEFELGLKKLALLASYVTVFLVVASSIRPSEARKFMALLVGLACLTSLGAIWEYRFGYNVFYDWVAGLVPGSTVQYPGGVELGGKDAFGRQQVIGPTGHPLAMAGMLALAVPFATVGILASKERRTFFLYALATALIFAGAVATVRKTSGVAPIAGLLVLAAYRPRAMFRLLPLGLVMVIGITLIAPGAIGSVRDQLNPAALFGANSTQQRQSDYDDVTPDIASHLAFGRGYGSYDPRKYRVLDNQYLAILIGTGFVGLAAYLAILAAIFLTAHRAARAGDPAVAPPALAIASVVVVFAVESLLFDALAFPHVPYVLFFCAGLAVVCALPTLRESAFGWRPTRLDAAEAARPKPAVAFSGYGWAENRKQ